MQNAAAGSNGESSVARSPFKSRLSFEIHTQRVKCRNYSLSKNGNTVFGERLAGSLRAAASINSSFLEYSGKTVRYAFNVETTRIVSHSRMHNAVPRVSHLPPLPLSPSLSIYLSIHLSSIRHTCTRTFPLPEKTSPVGWTLPTTTLLAS